VLFGVLYAVARLVTSHRRAVLVAFASAVLSSWLGPYLVEGHSLGVGVLGGGSLPRSALLALIASLLLHRCTGRGNSRATSVGAVRSHGLCRRSPSGRCAST
jgi:hypothetical protein